MAVIVGGIRVGIGLAAGQAADGASRGNRLHNILQQAEVLDVGMMARVTHQVKRRSRTGHVLRVRTAASSRRTS
jgi:hypothetical protein